MAVLLASLAAASTAGQARSASPQPKRLSNCRIASYNSLAGVMGPLVKKSSMLMPASMSFGKWWNCDVSSRAAHAWLNAFCQQPKQVAQVLFNKYSRSDLQGSGGLTWKPVRGLGDQAVFTHVSHDVLSGGVTTGYVVRRRNDIFIIQGSTGMKGMPTAELLRLTRLALRYNCA